MENGELMSRMLEAEQPKRIPRNKIKIVRPDPEGREHDGKGQRPPNTTEISTMALGSPATARPHYQTDPGLSHFNYRCNNGFRLTGFGCHSRKLCRA